MSNCFVGPNHQIRVPFVSTDFETVLQFQIQYILGVFRKSLPIVQGVAQFNASFKVCGSSLNGLVDLLLRHSGLWDEGHAVTNALAAVVASVLNGDAIGCSRFGFSFFNVCHDIPPVLMR